MRALRRILIALLVPLSLPVVRLLSAQDTARTDVARDLARLGARESIANLPAPDSVTLGPRSIAAGTTVRGSVVARGPITVAGRVEGAVVSLGGNVTIQRGGVVTGDALSVGGRVIADGVVGGEIRGMSGLPRDIASVGASGIDARGPAQRTYDAMRVVAGTFGVLLLVAVGVLLFAGSNLDEVVSTIERQFGRAFWVGLLGQLLILPGLVVLVVALALTIIGVLLIPFAIVAYAIAVAGLVTLGFLAVARLIGGALWQSTRDTTVRSRSLAALAVGLAVFFALWLSGAALTWSPMAATIARAVALAVTWTAITLGLGSAILSRAGTHRRVAAGTRPVELAAWQTPTPLTGVIAARRPVATAGDRA